MKIYFVRHGESESNAQEIHQSHVSKLSTKGISQAHFVAQRLSSIPINIILSSHYVRAFETATIISNVLQIDIIEEPLLRELKRPTEIEGKHFYDKETEHIKNLIASNVHDPQWHYSDEENIYDLMNRCLSFITTLKDKQHEHILVISHGVTIRMIIACMMYPPDKIINNFDTLLHFMHMTNTGITICERMKDNSFQLLTWNDYAHLEQNE